MKKIINFDYIYDDNKNEEIASRVFNYIISCNDESYLDLIQSLKDSFFFRNYTDIMDKVILNLGLILDYTKDDAKRYKDYEIYNKIRYKYRKIIYDHKNYVKDKHDFYERKKRVLEKSR